jgi:hypothetical protein
MAKNKEISDKKPTPEEQNRTRLQSIMGTIVQSPSTTSKPDMQFAISDIAFVIDYLKISPIEVEKIKRELVRKTPIIALVHTMSKMYEGEELIYFIQEWSTLSDDDARKEITKKLEYLETIIIAAKSANVKTDAVRLDIWKLFITALNDPSHTIPINVSLQITSSIIKNRCGVEPTFLQRTTKPFTDFNELFVNNEANEGIDHPLNTREELCPVVRNLNTVSDKSLEKTIKKCHELISRYKFEGLGLKEDDIAYKTIQEDVENFLKITREWHEMKTYECTTGSICTSKMEKLKLMADQVRSYAKTCSARITKQNKMHMKQQLQASTDNKKKRSWFFS